MARLASAIEAIGTHDRKLVEETARVDRLRAQGAADLHSVCRNFVFSLNERLSAPAVALDPVDYAAGHFSDAGPNLFQINLRGRLLQIEFSSTEELFSTDDFRQPYILQGTVRSFNQELLEHNTIDEHSIYYCLEGSGGAWRYFDCRTYRTGKITADFLASELERLL
jgi:hypothetical protein